MNPQDQSLTRIVDIVTKGTAGVIIVPNNPTNDAIAAATSLYLGLTKLGKTITLVASSAINDSYFTASDKFQNSLSTAGDNLVVSFPYTEGAIDKVDYNIQGEKFNLIISPRQGYPKLNPNQVSYSYSGGVINFIIAIDSPNLNSLGTVYSENQNQFTGKDIINIDRHLTNAFYGTVNYVNKTASSSCELIYSVLQKLGADIDKDIASNLYNGLSAATNNFSSYSVNAQTFEMAANLLKTGAVKKRITPVQPGFGGIGATTGIRPPSYGQPAASMGFRQPSPFGQGFTGQAPVSQGFSPGAGTQPTGFDISDEEDFGNPVTSGNQVFGSQPPQSQPQAPAPNFEKQNMRPSGTAESEPVKDEKKQTPQDWLKPKIFKGSGLI